MSLFSRPDRPVTPLSESVVALLRGMSTARPPGDLRTRVLAAYERSDGARSVLVGWPRLAFGGVAAAAAAAVLVVGGFVRTPSKTPAVDWEQIHAAPAETAKVRVVDDPTLAGVGAASLASLDPLEGP